MIVPANWPQAVQRGDARGGGCVGVAGAAGRGVVELEAKLRRDRDGELCEALGGGRRLHRPMHGCFAQVRDDAANRRFGDDGCYG